MTFTKTIFLAAVFLFFIWGNSGYATESGKEAKKPSRMVSLEASKKELKRIYFQGGHAQTLYCGCFFDKLLQVYPYSCEFDPERAIRERTLKTLRWAHLMRPPVFAVGLRCWNKPGCSQNGERCCQGVSPKFKTMQADMHNLIPVMADAPNVSPPSSENHFGGIGENRFCVKDDRSLTEPREGARGDIARIYFYMSYQYGVPIPNPLKSVLKEWHQADPPDEWEAKRNALIEIVQGNRNPFIDEPGRIPE